jgi:hypothetical protein
MEKIIEGCMILNDFDKYDKLLERITQEQEEFLTRFYEIRKSYNNATDIEKAVYDKE